MANTLISTAVKAAATLSKARKAYRESFEAYHQSIKPLSDDRFWELLDVLRQEIIFNPDKEKIAVDEFCRKAQAGHFSFFDPINGHSSKKCPPYTFMECMQFANNYQTMVACLSGFLEDKSEGEYPWDLDRSDDGLMDFSDGLPLAGMKVCQKLLANKYKSPKAFYDEILKHNPEKITYYRYGEKLTIVSFGKTILDGNWSVETFLFDEVRRRFVVEARS